MLNQNVTNPEDNKAHGERPVLVRSGTVCTPKLSNILARSGEVQCCESILISKFFGIRILVSVMLNYGSGSRMPVNNGTGSYVDVFVVIDIIIVKLVVNH